MVNPVLAALGFLIGFLCGSVPFGYLAGVINQIDIRKHGSGNIGFTNVQRILGLKWALPVLVLDSAKGVLPVIFARSFNLVPLTVGIGAVLGHIFTPWLKFNGVATTIGVAALLCPRSLLWSLLLFLIILFITGYVSLASISLALALPVMTFFFYRAQLSLLLFTIVIAIIIIYRHISNIRRLLSHREPKFGLWLRVFGKSL
jgi:glycerol-3-phosphate acyltransferase PlsY